MNIYTIILITVCILKVGVTLGKHGEAEVIEHDFTAMFFGQLLTIWLLLKSANVI